MSTGLDVISGALTAIGQLGQGQTASAEDGALGLRLINLLLSQASTKRLMLSYVASRQYTLSANVADYSIGPATASFIAVRPNLIESAQANVFGSNVWLPMSILDKPKWDALVNKGATADVPERIYPEYTFPNVAFHVDPKPLSASNIRLGTWEPLLRFATIFDPVVFPDAYEEWLESNLGIMMAPYYDQPVPQTLIQRAADGKLSVMSYNAQSMGGALGSEQTLQSPNVGQPIPTGPAPGAAQ